MRLEYKVLDLFSGAGGMALGFQSAGARCVGAVDADAAAAKTFKTMFAHDRPRVFGGPEDGDVNNLEVEQLLGALSEVPDLVVGGPPCQGFSRIGRAKHASLLEDEEERLLRGGQRDPHRNQLYRYFLGVVRACRPKAFVMENVPGMREMLGVDQARRISREAARLGYNVRYFLLNAVWYGVPQHRWRLFFIGFRRDLGAMAVPTPPVRTHDGPLKPSDFAAYPEDHWLIEGRNIPEAAELLPPVTVFQALGDLPRQRKHWSPRSGLGEKPKERRLPLRGEPSDYVKKLRAWPGLPAPEAVSGNWYRWTPRDFPIFAEMAEGDRYPQAIAIAHQRFRAHLQELRASGAEPPLANSRSFEALKKKFVPPYRNDAFDDKWRKLIMDRPSWTVTAHLSRDTYSHIHYHSRQARTITIREAARLQSFPDGFEFSGNFGERYRQIGNAVPPLLARAIAESVFEQLRALESGESAA